MKQSNLDLAKIFKALSSEQRLKLFLMIYENQNKKISIGKKNDTACCPGLHKAFTKACECLNVSRSTVSHHLKELQNAGLIKCHRDGQSFYCEVNKEATKNIKNFLK